MSMTCSELVSMILSLLDWYVIPLPWRLGDWRDEEPRR